MARQKAMKPTPHTAVSAASTLRRVAESCSSSVFSVTSSSGINSGSRYRMCCRGEGECRSSRTVMDQAMTPTPMKSDSSRNSGSWVRTGSLPLAGRRSPAAGSSTGNTPKASTVNSTSQTMAKGRKPHCSAVSQPVWL